MVFVLFIVLLKDVTKVVSLSGVRTDVDLIKRVE